MLLSMPFAKLLILRRIKSSELQCTYRRKKQISLTKYIWIYRNDKPKKQLIDKLNELE